MRRLAVGWLLSVALGRVASAQVIPAGGEFQVNAYTTGDQNIPAVAMDANADFVVVWKSAGQDGDGNGVFWRTFNSSGVTQAGTRANSYTTGDQSSPRVSSDARGNFVIVWESDGQDGDGFGIFARRFDASGTPQGAEFKANAHTQGNQRLPAVASDAAGNFMIVWQSEGQDGSDYGVFARFFDSAGNSVAGFRVNSYTTGVQKQPAVAADGNGNFVVVWESYQDGSSSGIVGRRFSGSGAALGAEFQVNTYTTYFQADPHVSADAAGNFAVVWWGWGSGETLGVFGRRFDAAGVAQGGQFLVNSYTPGQQDSPEVAMDADGSFVVVWDASFAANQDGSGAGVFGQRFDAAGAAQGSEFGVNSYTTGDQAVPAVATDSKGDFVVTWQSTGQDGSQLGVFAQRYGDLIFKDNFESGDTSRWTTSVTDGTDVDVTAAAALAGTAQGLRARVNDTNSLYVQDDTPDAESRYRARFYFDTNDFDPGEASGHQRVRIFLAQDASNTRIVTIVLKRLAGQYSLEARARQDDGTRVDTGFFDITNAPHFVEFDWKRATAPGANDGFLDFFIDDTPVWTLIDLDTDLGQVDQGRMGVLSVKTGAAGTLHFDQFESRRLNPIGPE
jgi:hypothetical protein